MPHNDYEKTVKSIFGADVEPEPEADDLEQLSMADMYVTLLKEIWKLQEKVDVCCSEIKLLKKAWGRELRDSANDVAM